MYSRISNALTASCQAPSSATNKTIAAAFRVSQRTMSVERQRHRVPSASTRPAFWEVEEEHAHRGSKIRWLVTVIVTVITTLTAATLGAGPDSAGVAHLVIDYGLEFNLMWVVFLDDTGECWAFDIPRSAPCRMSATRRGADQPPRGRSKRPLGSDAR